jgi:hypothetical protein
MSIGIDHSQSDPVCRQRQLRAGTASLDGFTARIDPL